jgi:phosphate transport system substrate-binding protein
MRSALAAFGGGLAAIALMTACLPPDKTPQTITLAGSDTTQDVMGAIAAAYNGDPSYNSDPDTLVNVLSQQFTPLTAPGDADCGSITWHTPAGAGEQLAPNGSSNGRNALKTSVQNGDGCVDVARSSGPPRAIPSDLVSFEYYAFALDALGWSSASTNAPANLTHQQLKDIYNCTHDDWSDVGGSPGPIERYLPQSGSGTYQFTISDLLGFDPALFSGPSCPAVQFTQENSGQGIAANGDQQTAIVSYSMGNWVAQARGTAPDQRSGQELGDLNGQNLVTFPGGVATPNTAPGPVVESNVKLVDPTPDYPGIRFVFNVVDNTHVRYRQALRFVGFENELKVPEPCGDEGEPDCTYPGVSPLCDGEMDGILNSYGFGTLDDTASSRNLNGTHCRLYTP